MTHPAQETLGLWPEPLPTMPRVLEGYQYRDLVWLFEGERRTKAEVIAVLRDKKQLVLKTDDGRHVMIAPGKNSSAICKRSAA